MTIPFVEFLQSLGANGDALRRALDYVAQEAVQPHLWEGIIPEERTSPPSGRYPK